MNKRNTYSILETVIRLHTDHTVKPYGDDLAQWLRWRITAGWEQPTGFFDSAVRMIAQAALQEYESRETEL